MNVLSVFDGVSCGRIALERAGIPVTNYYASEIDKYVIEVSNNNYPDIIQVGDVRDLQPFMLPDIDLLIGGSPCTNFSFAGRRQGMSTKCKEEILDLDHYLQLKQDGFEFVGQSYLFWEYMRIKHDLMERNQNLIFLLENVMMIEKWKDVLTKAIGVESIMINSALVSAQNRKRLYWTNIQGIEQPEDKGIVLKDILETGDLSDYTHSDKALTYMSRKTHDGRDHWDFGQHCDSGKDKSVCMVANLRKGVQFNVIIDRRPLLVQEATKKGHTLIEPGDCFDITHKNSKTRRGRSMKDKSNTLTQGTDFGFNVYQPNTCTKPASIYGRRLKPNGKRGSTNDLPLVQCLETSKDADKSRYLTTVSKDTLLTNLPDGRHIDAYNTLEENVHYRKLTPRECERLQTLPDDYTSCVSNSQRYKMIGNGWTCDVIAHMFRNIPWFAL